MCNYNLIDSFGKLPTVLFLNFWTDNVAKNVDPDQTASRGAV